MAVQKEHQPTSGSNSMGQQNEPEKGSVLDSTLQIESYQIGGFSVLLCHSYRKIIK